MNKKLISFIASSLLICSCSNLDNAKPANATAFTYFYGGTGNYQATAALEVADGFLIAGDSVGGAGYGALIIKTDANGKTQWRKVIPGATVSSVIATPNGYLLCGDSIKVDLTQVRVIDQTRTRMRLINLDANGGIIADKFFGSITKNNDPARAEIKGSAVTMDAQNNYIVTSSLSFPNAAGANAYTQVSAHDPSTLAIKWVKNYDQDKNRDYKNGKSVLITRSGDIIWPASSFLGTAVNGVSFLRIPVLSPDLTFKNAGSFGQNDLGNYYYGSDIKGNGVGFGIIGTFQSSTGQNANVFFLSTDQIGNPNSALFFDGPTSSINQPVADKTTSQVQDQGITLTTTSDGGFLLAGYTSTTTDGTWGNGGQDVYLIRLDPFGNMLWNKFLGGSGDEVPSSVIATSDGGFLIAGTATLAGQSSIFLMKTNSKGELKN
ncbi:MAG: hypothetical protein ACKVOQ_03360 [Cyclobacteriaceae bacterium]